MLGVFCDFGAFFWVLAENGFHGRMCLKGRNLRDFCESGKMGEKLAKGAKLPTPLPLRGIQKPNLDNVDDTSNNLHEGGLKVVREHPVVYVASVSKSTVQKTLFGLAGWRA